MTLQRIILLSTFLCFLWACESTQKQESSKPIAKTTVYYAGFGFLGRYDNLAEKFPHALRINQRLENNVGTLTNRLTETIKKESFNYIDVKFGLVDQNRNRPLMMALSVEREAFTRNSLNQPIAEVSVQALFFDYDTRTLVKTLNMYTPWNGNVEDGDFVLDELFDDVYLDENEGTIALTVRNLKNFELSDNVGLRFQVGKVSFADSVAKQIPDDMDTLIAQEFVGQNATAALSHYGLNMVPFMRGTTIGRQMAFRLADASVFDIKLPKPDYEWQISIDDARKLPSSNTRLDLYAIKMQVKLVSTTTGEVVLDIPVRRVTEVIRIKDGFEQDSWQATEDAIKLGVREFSQQLQKPNPAWCKSNSSGAQTCKKLKKLSQTIFK